VGFFLVWIALLLPLQLCIGSVGRDQGYGGGLWCCTLASIVSCRFRLWINTSLIESSLSMQKLKTFPRYVAVACVTLTLQACAVMAVADAAVTVVATGVKVTAKAVGAVVDAVIPDGD